jgi:hypothetical protein
VNPDVEALAVSPGRLGRRADLLGRPHDEAVGLRGLEAGVEGRLDGSGPAKLDVPKLADWPDVTWTPDLKSATRVNLDTLTKDEVAALTPGQE